MDGAANIVRIVTLTVVNNTCEKKGQSELKNWINSRTQVVEDRGQETADHQIISKAVKTVQNGPVKQHQKKRRESFAEWSASPPL